MVLVEELLAETLQTLRGDAAADNHVWIFSWFVSHSSKFRLHFHQPKQFRSFRRYSDNSYYKEHNNNNLTLSWTRVNVAIAHCKNGDRNEIEAWVEREGHFKVTTIKAWKFSKLRKKLFASGSNVRVRDARALRNFLKKSCLIDFS